LESGVSDQTLRNWLSKAKEGTLRNKETVGSTGRFIDDYTREHLFLPLGIDVMHWRHRKYRSIEVVATGGGLMLTSGDLLKIGQLVQNDSINQR
jgi:CubicO group peptidase (beta-lactamase class C family)